MANQKRIAFLSAFMTVWAIHKSGKPGSNLIDAYWSIMKTYDSQQIEMAFGRAMTELKFFPKPSELIGFLKEPKEPKELKAQSHAGYLVNAVSGKDYLNPDGWKDDPATARLLRGRFDIKRLHTQSMQSDLKWIEKDFVGAYLETADIPDDTKLKIEYGKPGSKTLEDVMKLTEGIG
jgi:hypothetical protein